MAPQLLQNPDYAQNPAMSEMACYRHLRDQGALTFDPRKQIISHFRMEDL
jgi:hypothetical protein